MPRTRPKTAAPLRAFALVGHRSSGKTQLAERLLHAAGVVRSPGQVEEGTTLLDFEAEERRRGAGYWPAFAWLPWDDAVLHLIDTPGAVAVSGPSRLAQVGADLPVVVISGPDGVERGAREALRAARDDQRPHLMVVTKLDRAGADLDAILDDASRISRRRAVLLQLPLVDEHGEPHGVIDLVDGIALRYADDGSGAWSPEPVPAHQRHDVDAARERLHEAVALTDDALLEAYLEHLELPAEALRAGLARAATEGDLLPTLLASGTRGWGVAPLLDWVRTVAPDPAAWTLPADTDRTPSFVAQWIGSRLDEEGELVSVLRVWSGELATRGSWTNGRTGAEARPRRFYAIRGPRRARAQHLGAGALVAVWGALPGRPGDAFTDGPSVPIAPPPARPTMAWLHVDVLGDDAAMARARTALTTLALLDPTLGWREDARTNGLILEGCCEAQLELAVERLRRRFGVFLRTGPPPVDYVERPARPVRDAHGLHRRESEGEIFDVGEVWIDVRPLARPDAVEFEGDVDPDLLPPRFLPPVGAGIRRALEHGPTAGYPVAGLAVRCTRGDYDLFESSEDDLEAAGEAAAREALEQAGTELFEPWSEVRVVAPSHEVGPVLSDLAAHRGRVVALEVQDDETSIRAQCPDRELWSLSRRLDQLTHGRGWFVARRSHYDRVPSDLVGEAVAASPFVHKARVLAHAK